MDLFSRAGQESLRTAAPLAARMRPRTLDKYAGQDHITGPSMISGFVGTLISLERAVALSKYRQRRAIYYLALLLAALGAMALSGDGYRRGVVAGGQQSVAGGLAGLSVAPWWAGFLVLTIAGERLKLSRVLSLLRSAH